MELLTIEERKVVNQRVVKSHLSLLNRENLFGVHAGTELLSVKYPVSLKGSSRAVIRMVVVNEVEELSQVLRV